MHDAMMQGMFTLAQAVEPAAPVITPPTSMGFWIVMLALMALAPFLFTLITSFAKLVILGGLLRQAMGTPQIPPNTVITGLALILTLHIMSPVAIDIYSRFKVKEVARNAALAALTPEERAKKAKEDTSMEAVRDVVDAAEPPIRAFLEKHAHRNNIALFERLQAKLLKSSGTEKPLADVFGGDATAQQLVRDITVLAPAFMLSELVEAFQIGFIIFIPFLVIDLVVSNILLAMGMHMLSPVTISMPFKLLLFVLIDGWTLILQGVVLNYA
jgi:type III secretion protein R